VGYLDVFLLSDVYFSNMEKTPGPVELIYQYFSDFSEPQKIQFEKLGDLYGHWNQMINVVSRKDIDSLYERHVLHSLSIAAQFDFPEGAEIVDIGTGGGFPGIPLAIYFPQVKFHLVDSIAKKLKVVDAIASELDLKNLTTQHTRAEELKGRKFDFAVSRAVAPLKDLWTWSKPLLRNERKMKEAKNGLICLKGGDLTEEIAISGLKPHVFDIKNIFKQEFFDSKYIVYVPL
jgi:16S rRNA (guanine527-N7)-methyltransferase